MLTYHSRFLLNIFLIVKLPFHVLHNLIQIVTFLPNFDMALTIPVCHKYLESGAISLLTLVNSVSWGLVHMTHNRYFLNGWMTELGAFMSLVTRDMFSRSFSKY